MRRPDCLISRDYLSAASSTHRYQTPLNGSGRTAPYQRAAPGQDMINTPTSSVHPCPGDGAPPEANSLPWAVYGKVVNQPPDMASESCSKGFFGSGPPLNEMSIKAPR